MTYPSRLGVLGGVQSPISRALKRCQELPTQPFPDDYKSEDIGSLLFRRVTDWVTCIDGSARVRKGYSMTVISTSPPKSIRAHSEPIINECCEQSNSINALLVVGNPQERSLGYGVLQMFSKQRHL